MSDKTFHEMLEENQVEAESEYAIEAAMSGRIGQVDLMEPIFVKIDGGMKHYILDTELGRFYTTNLPNPEIQPQVIALTNSGTYDYPLGSIDDIETWVKVLNSNQFDVKEAFWFEFSTITKLVVRTSLIDSIGPLHTIAKMFNLYNQNSAFYNHVRITAIHPYHIVFINETVQFPGRIVRPPNKSIREVDPIPNNFEMSINNDAILTGKITYPYKRSVLNDWVQELSLMQQAVLLSAIRNADGIPKGHKSKALIRWYRRCVLMSAFDRCELRDPFEQGGGSFTGPIEGNIDAVSDDFIDSRDEMTLHYYAHAMHAFEILGYKHPEEWIRKFWYGVYERMCHALHMWPETEEQMDQRLGDDEENWLERSDPSTCCSD